MNWRIRDKRAARRATTAAQAGAVVLLASGAAMAMLGPRLLDVEEPEAPGVESPEQPVPAQAIDAQPRAYDAAVIGENFSYLANKPVPDAEPELAAEEAPPDVAPTSSKNVRYVGAVRMGQRRAAFINIAGVTKLLRPGQEHDGVRLVSVEDERVVVAIDGGPEEAVAKADREGPAVSVVVGGAPEPEPAPVVAGDSAEPPRFTPDMSREERRAMLLERARDERSRWERDRDERGERFPPDRIDN
ncbi:MAG TPA: hypothetical protein VFF69_12265 [Phycisphaerales bacterium]|nr:hypothetical protein [Phycisphaerales bacterium]